MNNKFMTTISYLLSPLHLLLLVHLAANARASCQQSDHQSLVCIKMKAKPVYVGEIAELQCVHSQTGRPVKVVRWKVNGSLLRNDRVVLSPPTTLSKLTIRKARLSDSGNYSCVTRIDTQDQAAYVQFKVFISKPVSDSHPSVSYQKAVVSNTEAAYIQSRPRETMLEHSPSSSCSPSFIQSNAFPSWLLSVIVASSSLSIASAAICYFYKRKRQTSRSLSAENPTYSLVSVAHPGERDRLRERREMRSSGLHLYETMSGILNTETEQQRQESDGAGYTIVHARSQSSDETVDVSLSPSSITEPIPKDTTCYMVMKRKQDEEDNGSEDQKQTTVADAYVNIDDPQLK